MNELIALRHMFVDLYEWKIVEKKIEWVRLLRTTATTYIVIPRIERIH